MFLFYFKLFLFLFLIIIIFNLIIIIFYYIFLLFCKIVSGYTIVSLCQDTQLCLDLFLLFKHFSFFKAFFFYFLFSIIEIFLRIIEIFPRCLPQKITSRYTIVWFVWRVHYCVLLLPEVMIFWFFQSFPLPFPLLKLILLIT